MKRALSFTSIIFVLCVTGLTVSAQKTFSIGGPASENFDGMGTGTVNLTNNSTIAGVYAVRSVGNANPNGLAATNGSSTAGGLYNNGTTGAADRALGTISTTASGMNHFGMRLLNTGATAIGSITVQYTGEQWRHGNGANEVLTFEYQTGGSVTSLTSGTWTSVPALSFTSPTNPPGQAALDGNAAANRTVLSATFAVTIPAGTEIMLRWTDIVDSAQPDAFGVDDVTVTALAPSAGEASISGRVTDSYGRAISSAAIRVQDFNGMSKMVYTNTFGHYSVKGLDAGQTYIVGVSARRYTFVNPTMVVDLSDNFTGANFVASR